MTSNRSSKNHKITLDSKRNWGWKKVVKFKKFLNNRLFVYSMCLKKKYCYRFKLKDTKSKELPKGSWFELRWESEKLDQDTSYGTEQIIEFGNCQQMS